MKKVKTKKKKKFFIGILILIIILIAVIIFINLPNSKTLSIAKNDENFNKDYTTFYENIKYVDSDNFIKNINNLIKLGYGAEEINLIYDTFNDEEIEAIINSNFDDDLINYIKLDYFKSENIKRYIDFKFDENKLDYSYFGDSFEKDLSYEDIVTYVNIGLDQDYYTNVINVEKPDDLYVIVNKYHKLSETYEPEDLMEIDTKYSVKGQKLRKDAKESFEEMAKDAQTAGYNIYAGSAYRSYSYQDGLYNKYVLEDGFINAETYSARAGYSEHQTGLAVDILNSNWTLIDENDAEYKWLIDNSYKYGFILRYKRGKENITGYMFEDWHFRYFGNELAKKLYETDLTYEEYLARGNTTNNS